MMILAGCGSSGGEEKKADSGKEVLKVGVECAYPPFNWTQTEETTTSGKEAEPIYGTSQYAYGYDVAVAQEIARALDMDLEVHKSEWASITQGLDAGDYDVIISGMGRTAKREQSYDFTDPYYYRTNCLVVKKARVWKKSRACPIWREKCHGDHAAGNWMGGSAGSDSGCHAGCQL